MQVVCKWGCFKVVDANLINNHNEEQLSMFAKHLNPQARPTKVDR
jgi:hypothetical protein